MPSSRLPDPQPASLDAGRHLRWVFPTSLAVYYVTCGSIDRISINEVARYVARPLGRFCSATAWYDIEYRQARNSAQRMIWACRFERDCKNRHKAFLLSVQWS